MEDTSDLLMLTAVTAECTECGGERIFMPVDGADATGELCCTDCDAAVFLLTTSHRSLRGPRRRDARSAGAVA